MMAARSTLLGQRALQVSQEAQYQIERPARTRSHWPSCRSRTIRFGGCSMKADMGHPAEHLPHWKQRRTELPERDSTFLTKPTFIVSLERCINLFFTANLARCDLLQEAEAWSIRPMERKKQVDFAL